MILKIFGLALHVTMSKRFSYKESIFGVCKEQGWGPPMPSTPILFITHQHQNHLQHRTHTNLSSTIMNFIACLKLARVGYIMLEIATCPLWSPIPSPTPITPGGSNVMFMSSSLAMPVVIWLFSWTAKAKSSKFSNKNPGSWKPLRAGNVFLGKSVLDRLFSTFLSGPHITTEHFDFILTLLFTFQFFAPFQHFFVTFTISQNKCVTLPL